MLEGGKWLHCDWKEFFGHITPEEHEKIRDYDRAKAKLMIEIEITSESKYNYYIELLKKYKIEYEELDD